jgi:sterol desaturase/sphingolipid hydroxylase (fatty acid hydroxylase superfamily)
MYDIIPFWLLSLMWCEISLSLSFNLDDLFFFRDNMVIMQTLIAAVLVTSRVFPATSDLSAWDLRGWAIAVVLHVAVSEPAFYWAHRALHLGPLFSRYHSLHHSFQATQALTGNNNTLKLKLSSYSSNS